MTLSPENWRKLTPEELVGGDRSRLVIGPFGSNLKRSDYRETGVPLIFVRDIRNGTFRQPSQFVASEKAAELASHLAIPGDVLITKMGDPPGDACVYVGKGPAVITADCIRLRPIEEFDARYIAHAFGVPSVADQLGAITQGVAQRKVSLGRFRTGLTIPIPVLAEQRRIVEMLEDHLSRLDAAEAYTTMATARLKSFIKSLLVTLIPDQVDYPVEWRRASVAEAGRVELGRQRHPDWHTGPNMRPYLRVANVFEDRIDTRDVKEMHWPEGTFERFRLKPGDVLLNEGQTPDLLGRPALYSGYPAEVAFTNSLIRFQARPEVLPEFALLVFRRHMHAGRFKRESRITTNIAHLSAARLKPIEFPVPPLADQKAIVAAAEERLAGIALLQATLQEQRRRSAGLRRAVLAAAFSGKLTGRHTDQEVIEELADV